VNEASCIRPGAQGPILARSTFQGQRYRVRQLDLSALDLPDGNDSFVNKLGLIAGLLQTRQLSAVLHEVAKPNGFDSISYSCWVPRIVGESTFWIFSPLSAATEASIHERGLLEMDEVAHHCRCSHVPEVWRADSSGLKMQAPDLHETVVKTYRSRVCFPVHGRHREWGALCFNSHLPDVWAAQSRHQYQILCEGQMLAQYIHQWVAASGLLWDLSEEGTRPLTDKEKEIVRLGALGFESHEIAPLVGLTKRAIDYIFQQVNRKLQATNRQESITTALELGLIAL
jgi:DNA-binding CsgD family transcriptional regulator